MPEWAHGVRVVHFSHFFDTFWYFWLTIQNTADRQVRNLFCLLAVFFSFPLARAAVVKSAKAGLREQEARRTEIPHAERRPVVQAKRSGEQLLASN